jgi:hypothetical protein
MGASMRMPIRAMFTAALLTLPLTAATAPPAVALAPAAAVLEFPPGPVLPPKGQPPNPLPAPASPRIAYITGTAHTLLPSVWVADAHGQEPKKLGLGIAPLVSPNGQSVAVDLFSVGPNPEAGPSIGIYSTAGAPVAKYLSLATGTAAPLAWSPDSRYLAVSVQSNALKDIAPRSSLVVIDTATGAVHTITNGSISGASFAPDGTDRLVYSRALSLSVNAGVNLYVSGPEGAGITRLTNDGRSLNPLWGPRYIAYDRERPRHESPEYQIWLRSPAGGAPKKLTKVPVAPLLAGLVPIAFSADGSRLVAEFVGEDTSEAWTVRVPSGRAHRIIVHGQPVVAAGISRDGFWVLVDELSFENAPSVGRVAEIPFTGGPSTVLIPHGAQASWNG